MDKNTKTSIVLGVIAVIVILMCFLVSNVDDTGNKESIKGAVSAEQIMSNAQNEAAAIADNERTKLISIGVDEYLQFYSDDDKTLIFVGSGSCPYCAIAKPIVEHFAYEYDMDIYFLDTGNFSGNDESDFVSSNDYFSSGFGIPMLLYVGNNELIDIVDGLVDTEHYMEFFTINKIVIE